MRAGERLFLAVIAAAVLTALGADIAIYRHGWQVIGFPAVLGTAIVLLCAIRVLKPRSGDHGAAASVPRLPLPQILRLAAGFVSILPIVMICGFKFGLPAYAALYAKLRGENWRSAAIVGAVALAGVLLFVQLLGMPEPRGLLPWP